MYTKGNWVLDKCQNKEDEENYAISILKDGATTGDEFIWKEMGTVYANSQKSKNVESRDNAILICAAPKMYEALIKIFATRDACVQTTDVFAVLQEIRYARNMMNEHFSEYKAMRDGK